ELARLRSESLQKPAGRGYLVRASAHYIKLMESESIIAESDKEDLQDFLENPPEPGMDLVHFLWVYNAYARYLCFIEKDYQACHQALMDTLQFANSLFQKQFESFDQEIKSLPLILALNHA